MPRKPSKQKQTLDPEMAKQYPEVAAAIERAGRKRDLHTVKLLKRGNPSDLLKIFRSDWESSFREFHPEEIPEIIVPTRQGPRVKRQLLAPLDKGNFDQQDFVKFLFEEWRSLRQLPTLRRLRDYPRVPAIEWVLRFSNEYLQSYANVVEGKSNLPDLVSEAERELAATKQQAETDVKQSRAELMKVVERAKLELLRSDRELKKALREISQLKAEIKRLRSSKRRGKTGGTAKPYQPPEWD